MCEGFVSGQLRPPHSSGKKGDTYDEHTRPDEGIDVTGSDECSGVARPCGWWDIGGWGGGGYLPVAGKQLSFNYSLASLITTASAARVRQTEVEHQHQGLPPE